jgi:hypothetical protein
MLTLEITAWNYSPGHSADEPVPNSDMVFDRTIEEQDIVAELQAQFNQLERHVRGGSAMIDGYRYRFAFVEDGVPLQVYVGATCHAAWGVRENDRGDAVPHPYAILTSLHESIGLPIWTDSARQQSGHHVGRGRVSGPGLQPIITPPNEPLTAQGVLDRLEKYRK